MTLKLDLKVTRFAKYAASDKAVLVGRVLTIQNRRSRAEVPLTARKTPAKFWTGVFFMRWDFLAF
jgi:hypothetical protein